MHRRNFSDWLSAFMDYASFGEAPRHLYFWTGVSTLAGALRRKVWIDQSYFKWFCNFYVVIVAPPGIVSKSTTAAIGMNLLRQVPGIKFGPDVVTWPALVSAFAESTETFEWHNQHNIMSAITLEASELGNLLNTQDREMVDLFVTLWDGKQGAFDKRTKHSGSDKVENPWINLIACTTPSWIAGNFPEYMIGGGLTSRCVFVYASEKSRYVAYPGLEVPQELGQTRLRLIQDLEHISMTLAGEYRLSEDAVEWGRAWYMDHYKNKPLGLDDERFGGYIARKQTHIHKLAMVLQASRTDTLLIEQETLADANAMVTSLEADMPFVFSKIGRSDASFHVERLLSFIRKSGKVSSSTAYNYVHANFPSAREYDDVLSGLIKSGLIYMKQDGAGFYLYPALNGETKELPK